MGHHLHRVPILPNFVRKEDIIGKGVEEYRCEMLNAVWGIPSKILFENTVTVLLERFY